MPFPFTFDFTVPGFANPFAPSSKDPLAPPPLNAKLNQSGRPLQTPVDRQYHSQGPLSGTRPGASSPIPAYPTTYPSAYPIQILPAQGTRRISRADLPKINRPRPSPSLSPSPAPLSRKRGWEPDPSPSWSTTSLTLASTSGYLDTPAKHRQMAEQQEAINTGDQDYRASDNRHAEDGELFLPNLYPYFPGVARFFPSCSLALCRFVFQRGVARPAECLDPPVLLARLHCLCKQHRPPQVSGPGVLKRDTPVASRPERGSI